MKMGKFDLSMRQFMRRALTKADDDGVWYEDESMFDQSKKFNKMITPQNPNDFNTKVFVYGTLKRGMSNHHLIEDKGGKFLGSTFLDGLVMIHEGGFPAVFIQHLATPPGRTVGEVYEITAGTLLILDRLEGVPVLYKRTDRMIPGFGWTWLYLQDPPTERYNRIVSGIWEGPETKCEQFEAPTYLTRPHIESARQGETRNLVGNVYEAPRRDPGKPAFDILGLQAEEDRGLGFLTWEERKLLEEEDNKKQMVPYQRPPKSIASMTDGEFKAYCDAKYGPDYIRTHGGM